MLTLMQFLITKKILCWRPKVKELYYFRVFPVCFFFFFVLQLYNGTLHWIQTQTVEKVNWVQQSVVWCSAVRPWRGTSLLCLCTHCLTQRNRTFDKNSLCRIILRSPSYKFAIFLLETLLLFGHTVVAKLEYSWDLWSLRYWRLPNT